MGDLYIAHSYSISLPEKTMHIPVETVQRTRHNLLISGYHPTLLSAFLRPLR